MKFILARRTERAPLALVYAWSGVAIMWAFWVSFVIFLAEPRPLVAWWPLPTVDRGGASLPVALAACVDLGLIGLFALQHSVMARPWFKKRMLRPLPAFLERSTYVHMANAALLTLILCWQPIPVEVWNVEDSIARAALWTVFSTGWVVLLLGACSLGMRELLGIEQVQAARQGRIFVRRLKTRRLYRWIRHPMYVGVLMGIWVTPRMSVGHLLLAFGFTGYVLVAMRYEERDLMEKFGVRYTTWRNAHRSPV